MKEPCIYTLAMAVSFKIAFSISCHYFFIIFAETTSSDQCLELSCSPHGPPIRFPFRLKDSQPERCGYNSGFDLFCNDKYQTLLELPVSVQVLVDSIDYQSQLITVSDPEDCIPRKLANLTLSASPFLSPYFPYNYTLINCSVTSDKSAEKRRYDSDGNFSCLDLAGYQVVAYSSYTPLITKPPFSCRKMYSVSSVPYCDNANITLSWMEPYCGDCEAQGGQCKLKENSSERTPQCVKMPNHAKGSSKGKLLAREIVGPLLLLLVVVTVYHFYTIDKMERESYRRIKRFLEDYKALKPARYSFKDIKRITNQFKDELGQGAYGTVFQGKLSSEVQVAVKVLSSSTGNGEEFINEMEAMCQIHHVNVVRLVGFCADGLRRAIVYEFLPNGSLQRFILSADTKDLFLGWEKLQDIALGIAKGVEYLHQGCDKRILHFDIKPHNILLDNNFMPKISDFGLTKLCSKDQSIVSMTTARGTIGYIAPEVFSRSGNVSYKSDVYSYGMVLLEMVGGRKIMDTTAENSSSSQAYHPQWIYNLLENNEDITIHIDGYDDTKIAKKLSIVGLWCIQWHPVNHPTMKDVVQMLEGDGDNLAIPPNPFASNTQSKTSSAGIRLKQKLSVISEIE